jgi:predicted dehydrogenase
VWRVTRRELLRTASALAAAPLVISSTALGAGERPSPSERTTIGAIGVGGRGTDNLRSFLTNPRAEVIAVCDVDAGHLEAARQRVEAQTKGCAAVKDFREIVARQDIDAVSVSTPDHWHVPIAVAAAKAGKDIYCEKPLSLTVAEGRTLADTMARYGRVFQTGSQLRSSDRFRFGCELARNGRAGKLHTIRVGLPTGSFLRTQPEMPVPAGFDYDFWLGQAPWEPYTRARCHFTFRYMFDYSGGTVTDFGCHDIDLAQWGHGTQFTGPTEIEGRGELPRDGLSNTATTFRFRCAFADGVMMEVWTGYPHSVKFEGTDGWVYVGRDRNDAEPKSLLSSTIGPDEIHLYRSRDHHDNFLDCVRTRRPTIAPAEVAHRTASICHLANIAMRLGRKLKWDPAAERCVGDDEANRMLSRTMRPPWSL